MYLKKLYAANKWWFIIIVLFIIVQLTMDIKQGVAISPVFHYGMYSGVMLPQNEYQVTEISVNGKQLQTKDFSPYQWDKITQPIDLFRNQQNWNTHVWNDEVHRLLHFNDSTKYINQITNTQFIDWYKSYLGDMLHMQIDTININTASYSFDGNKLTKKTN